MSKFKLVSKYKPCGDQPKAIRELTDSILSGKRYQTLLGVTGSGKSLGGEESFLIFTKDKKNNFSAQFGRIGHFIDKIMEDSSQDKLLFNNTENIFQKEDKYYTLSFNPKNYEIEMKPITAFIRHPSPKKMYLAKTACGREILVTADHNFWVLRNGKLILISTDRLRNTDYVPLPKNLPVIKKDFFSISLFEYLEKGNFYIEADELLIKLSSLFGKEKIINFFSNYFKSPYNKLYSISKIIKGRRLSLKIFLSLLDKFNYILSKDELCKIRITGKTNSKHSLLATALLSEDFLSFLGYFIAEGHAQEKYIIITAFDKEIRKDLISVFKNSNFSYGVRRNSDFQISSKLLSSLLKNLVGENARNKKLPKFWPLLSQKQLAIMLRAYFEGDATIERNRGVIAVTASQELASGLTYALLRFGIWARISKVFKRAYNSPHAGDWYWQVSIYSQENLRAFAKDVGFISSEKISKLKTLISHQPHSNVDLIFGVGSDLKQIRKSLVISQDILAREVGINRSAISMIESGFHQPQNKTFQKLIGVLEKYSDNPSVSVSIKEKIKKIKGLSNCHWTPLIEVRCFKYRKPYVYDISVKDNETFLAGQGGLFLHNTFTLANVIAKINLPTLVISHNKTLAAQLYSEFKDFFPHNAVEYFVSYYDYYQPEAYIPATDTYIEKDASINDRLDRLRLSTTTSLMSRNDVLIVASVSCIYNLGDPKDYQGLLVFIEKRQTVSRDDLISRFIQIQYERNDYEFIRGRLRVRGDCLEVYPSYLGKALRIEFLGDTIEKISEINPVSGEVLNRLSKTAIYPAKHFIVSTDKITTAIQTIKWELEDRLKFLRSKNKLLEAQRLESRTNYDIEMLKEIGYCHGIENYSRHLSGRPPGSRPYCMIDYFPGDFLTVIDESHATIPQIRGMYEGDRARKEVLVEYGFRLPSCLDNRPLKFEEFNSLVKRMVFVSATPAEYELKKSQEKVIEQIIRPTGLVDPEVIVKPTENQIEDLIEEVKRRAKNNERVLVTTLTKRMAEDLTSYLQEKALKVKYLHSEIQTIERSKILKGLRRKDFDCLVGINLLREGLDLPEVSLVVILDADKEGFLRSETSLIQVSGRAARNIHGTVIMYADTPTHSMKRAINESNRRRKIQLEFNKKNKITPRSIQKAIRQGIEDLEEVEEFVQDLTGQDKDEYELNKYISELEYEMELAARNLQFEKAVVLRDKIKEIKGISKKVEVKAKVE